MTAMQPPEAFRIRRRLLGPEDTAAKLGHSKSWLAKNRTKLNDMDFPPPVVGGISGEPLRWDERAIDLWLDSRMPPHLRNLG